MHIGLPLMDWLLTLLLFSLSPTPSLFLRSKNLLLSSQCKTIVQPAIKKTVSVVRQKRFIALTPNVKFRAISFFSLRENLVVSTRRFYRSLESNKNLPKCLQPKKQISCWSYRLKMCLQLPHDFNDDAYSPNVYFSLRPTWKAFLIYFIVLSQFPIRR